MRDPARLLIRLSMSIAGVVLVGASAGCSDGGEPRADDCGASATRIHAIQGDGRSSPLLRPAPGEEDLVVEAIVVGRFPDFPQGLGGFFLQQEDGEVDDDPRTSEGLFVFDTSHEFRFDVGDRVRVRGRVAEFFGLTELVEISSLVVCPRRGTASAVELQLPMDDEADWERWEGMRVEFDQQLFVTAHHNMGRFGEVDLAVRGRLEQPTQRAAPGPPAREALAQNKRRRILLDDGRDGSRPEPTPYLIRDDGGSLRLGDSTAHLEGILDFAFGRFRIQPTGPVHFDSGGPRPDRPPDLSDVFGVEGTLRVVAWNVENHMNGDGRGGGFPTRGPQNFEEWRRQRSKLAETLLQLDPDIAALVEVENDGTGSESAIGQLVQEMNDRTTDAPFVVIHPELLPEGGHSIAVAIVYRRDAVAPIGPAAVLDTGANPKFDDRRNRPSLAQSFRVLATGEPLMVVVNHFKSKGSDCDSVGDPDEGDGQGDCNLTRTAAARALSEWLVADRTRAMGVPVLLLGDLNAYPMEDPLRVLELAGYVDLISRFQGSGEYTFVFDGQAGRLDYALAGSELLPFVAGAGVWHTNADEPPVFDYQLGNSPENFRPNPFRASDHDPVLVELFPDADADGLTDRRDQCPDSDRSATIALDGCDSGIQNSLDEAGCSLSDELFQSLDFDLELDGREGAVQDWIGRKIEEGRIEPGDRSAFLSCLAGASAEAF
jgi:predicted extracellular nuclease